MKTFDNENEIEIKVKKPKRKRNKKPKKTSEQLREIRSQASKKGWETRRQKAIGEKSPKVKPQKTKKTPEELREIRSQASKKGWETRRQKAKVQRAEIERQNLLELIADYYRDQPNITYDTTSRYLALSDFVTNLSIEQIAGVSQRIDQATSFRDDLWKYLYTYDDRESDIRFNAICSVIQNKALSLDEAQQLDTSYTNLEVDKETGEVIT